MSLSVHLTDLFRSHEIEDKQRRLQVSLASTPEDVQDAQRLRHQVLIREMGGRLNTGEPGIEDDRFDEYCQHLIVRDLANDTVVGCYRILTELQAVRAGGFHAQTEFDMTRVLVLPGRIMEVGRICVHPDYRTGAVVGLLWRNLARYMVTNRFDYLMGGVSIPLRRGTEEALALYRDLSCAHLAPAQWRVYPKVPLPCMTLAGVVSKTGIPPLIKACLRMGAKICGDPAWNPHFNAADLFILLGAGDIRAPYLRHFVSRI